MTTVVGGDKSLPPEAACAPPDLNASLALMRVFLQLQGVSVDRRQLAHQAGLSPAVPGKALAVELLLSMGMDARLVRGTAQTMGAAGRAVLAFARDGRWMIAAPAGDQRWAVQVAAEPTGQTLTDDQMQTLWSGEWVDVPHPPPERLGAASPEQARERFGLPWFWQAIKKHRALLGEVLLASFFAQVFALVTPLVFQVVIDKVLTHRTLSTLDVLVIALAGIAVFEVALAAIRHHLFSHATHRMDVELGARLFRHLLHLPLSYFESRRSGDTVARVRELDNVRGFLTGQALTSWLDLVFAVVFLAVMFYYSPLLTLIVLASLPVFFGASWIVTPLLRRKLEDKFSLGAENQAYLVETVTSMETVKAQAVEPLWQRAWEQRLAVHAGAAFDSAQVANATNQFIALASKLLTVVLLWFGARLVIDGSLSVGGLIAFNMLAGRVNAPILKLASLWQDIAQMKVSVKRLADILDAPAEPVFQPERASVPVLRGQVRFEQVSFRYAPDLPEVIRELSVEIKPGEVVGVVGISGAGKTTLMRLMQRLYTPTSGRVLLDGMDLNLADTSWLRRQMGVVGQDTLLFNRSVRENLALGQPMAEMEEVERCARLAGAHEFIIQLPQGYDTVIGERGSRLSGGQRARLAIARALMGNPSLLLLDEATAALDYESERVIHDHMKDICAGRTVVIVAHRLPTLRLAHRILVLEHGRLVDAGTHAELIARGGRYADLYRAHNALEVA